MQEEKKRSRCCCTAAVLSAGQRSIRARRSDLNQDLSQLGSQLCLAILRGDNREAKELLSAGAPIDHRDEPDGWTPLMYSIFYNNPKGRELLFSCGADPLVADFAGRTTLMFAAITGNRELLCDLLNRGVPAFAVAKGGKTALTFAEEYQNAICIDFLRPLEAETALPIPSGSNY